ncbi:MAG: copper amine oxidase N-terminal domain-containing protein [Clostridia bacterium]|nr:copper amine oxidase N-terminal domain-containing protein [Clostridia bacterium]
MGTLLKKISACAVAGFIMMCSICAYAELISEEKIIYKNPICDVYAVGTGENEWYVTDADNNIFGGPYKEVSNFSDFAYAMNYDGSRVLFDKDGSVLAEAPANYEIYPPCNGIYAIANALDTRDVFEFTVYDYATKEKLFTSDRFFMYYLEQQTDKMFIEKDGKYAIINRKGEFITDYIYDDVKQRFNPNYEPFPHSYAIVVQDGVEKYIDWDLNEINLDNYNGEPFVTNFNRLHKFGTFEDYKNYYQMESGKKRAVYDMDTGTYIVPFQDKLEFFAIDDKYIYAGKDGRSGLLDRGLKEVLPFEYNYLSADNKFGFVYFSKSNGEGIESGFLDMERNTVAIGFDCIIAEKGIFIKNYTDYSNGYKRYCAEILNAAGHNLTGKVYAYVIYEDGVFKAAYSVTAEEHETVEVDRNFAVIKLNGKYLDFDGVIVNDRTLVPMREIIEGYGGVVDWNADNTTVRAEIDGKVIELAIGSNIMKTDGTEKELDVPAQIINDKTMLPLRAVSEEIGAKVDWDERIKCVYIDRLP